MKRQNHHRYNFIWRRILFSAVLTAVLLVNTWAAVPQTALAAGAGNAGRLFWHKDDKIWGNLAVDGLDGKLNLTVNQVTVGSKSYTLNVDKKEGSDKQVMKLSENYASDAAFSLKDPIQDPVYDSGATYKVGENTYNISYVNFLKKGTVTYYKTVTNKKDGDTFSNFENEVRERYQISNPNYTMANEKVSSKMLMTTQDNRTIGYGLAFKASVEAYMQEKGAKEYTGSISLVEQESGKTPKKVVRIDMITVSYIDYYFTVNQGYNSIHKDYDLTLYTPYTYYLNGEATITLPSPTITLESGTAAQADGVTTVSLDDALESMSYTNPFTADSQEYKDYTEIEKNIKCQYVFSDTELSVIRENAWKNWEGQSVALEQKKYLYVRTFAEEPTGENAHDIFYKINPSAPVKYELSYLTGDPAEVTAELKSAVVLSTPDDKVTLTSGDEIFYTTDGSAPVTGKVTLTAEQKTALNNALSAGAYLAEYDGRKYIRVDGIWYGCSSSVKLYDANQPVQLAYTDGTATIQAVTVSNGKRVKLEPTRFTYTKLNPPTALTEDGEELTEAKIAAENRISLQASDPFKENVTLKYYADSSPALTSSEERWEIWNPQESVISLKQGEYLFVKAESADNTRTDLVPSGVKRYRANFIADPPDPVTASVETDVTVGTPTGNEQERSDTVRLQTTEKDAMIFYTMDGSEPTFTGNQDAKLITELNQAAPGKDAVSLVHTDGKRYVRVNRIWYLCSDGVELYQDGISLAHSKITGSTVNIKAKALADGKVVTDAANSFFFTKLETPEFKLESKKEITDAISQGDAIVEMKGGASDTSKVIYQYLTSDKQQTSIPDGNWLTFKSGSTIPLNGKEYLYVRVIPGSENSGYTGSIPQEYQIRYIEDTPDGVKATAYAGDQVVEGGVDYGDKIELIRLTTTEEQALIFYTLNGSEPVFTKVANEDRAVLDKQYSGTTIGTVLQDGNRYVRLNGLWYRCGADTKLYEDKITVDESIYTANFLEIHAQALTEGKVIGAADRFTYSFSLRSQVESPTANPKDGESISMGESISLYCSTEGSRIFYTVNGSAPVITLKGDEIKLGIDTYEFTNEPITVTDDIAEYGSTFTVTAIACSVSAKYGDLVRTMKDSALVKFVYNVTDQPTVEPVTSVPSTDAENQTIVEIGTKIRLFSATDGVTIFYTTDGSEPIFDEATLEPKNSATRKYSGSEGITVPEIGDSSLFTITAVAYKEGLASSAISRLIFAYPSAVSSPYASPAEGAVTENTQVTLKTATEGAVIYYEIAYNGETPKDPTEESNVFDSANPFTITKKTTIKAYAVKDGMDSQIVTFTYEVSEKLSTPTPSIDTGSVVASGTVIGLKADKDATIYYTVDGSDPKKADNQKVLVGDSVIISGKAGDVISVRTYAAKTGYSDSEVGYYSYSISSYEGGIFADKETGSIVKNGEIIHLNSDVSGATIHYTTDGSTPGESSPAGSAVTITGTPGENVIVKAIAIADGTDKAVSAATFTYTIMDRLAAPSASVPDGAVFTEEGVVELTSENGRIYYTTDGTDPTTASNLYKKAISIKESVTIKAVAVADDYEQSEISTFSYGFADQVATPIASFASGELEVGTEVTFSTETEDATIYYRTDGVDPNPDEKTGLNLYTGPVKVEKAVTFKVIAVKNHMADSKILTAGYTVREPVVVEETVEEETVQDNSGTGRLQSRRNFSNAQTGPSFTDVVLKNAVYGVVISANEDVLPANVQLLVEQTGIADASERMVKQIISENYGLVAAYNVTLLSDGQEVQPEGQIEIGLPIPAEYENSIVQVVCLQEDGSVETFETRRSGGEAYIKTNHLSVYAIAAPTEYSEGKKAFPWLPVIYSAAVVLAGIGILLLHRSRKKREDERAE